MISLFPVDSSHPDGFGGTECVEAVDEGDADLDFSGLAVWVSCRYALAKGFEAPHLRFDPAPGVVSFPTLPERPAEVPCGAQVLFLTIAAGQSSFHGRPFLRIGMIGVARRSMMAVWQRRVS